MRFTRRGLPRTNTQPRLNCGGFRWQMYGSSHWYTDRLAMLKPQQRQRATASIRTNFSSTSVRIHEFLRLFTGFNQQVLERTNTVSICPSIYLCTAGLTHKGTRWTRQSHKAAKFVRKFSLVVLWQPHFIKLKWKSVIALSVHCKWADKENGVDCGGRKLQDQASHWEAKRNFQPVLHVSLFNGAVRRLPQMNRVISNEHETLRMETIVSWSQVLTRSLSGRTKKSHNNLSRPRFEPGTLPYCLCQRAR